MSLPLAKLMQDVFSEIESFKQGRDFPDDVCLVGMEIAHLVTATFAAGTGKHSARARTLTA